MPVAEVAAPIALASRPGTGQRYVASRLGQVWLLDPSDGSGADSAADAGAASKLVADIGSRVSQGCENGLLGAAFGPDGDQLYLSYTDTARNSRIVVVPMEGEVPQTGRARVLLALDQPACNHNGGEVQLGPDGNLWIGFGDGGGADDIFGQGQDRSTLLGTLLRIDPDPPSGRGYGIPEGNPFASGNAPEVWAYGARNPWRFSFDRLTGDLWIADVGQNRIEEVHVLPAADGWSPGANLGWPLFEGNERFSGEATPADLVFPVYTYTHDDGCSVTGGYVYRGSAIEALWGAYVFGDYCTGDLWGLVRGPGGAAERIDLGVSVPRNTLVSFGEDAAGELYALSAAGTVFRLQQTTIP
ncbi:MAG: PQQ-dependent sugar dehydrogenase [Chloroflexota bacterium]|nr:PQQ-dependent sugar dehydrogenase [Chloroflexota bacterium]